MLVEIHAGTIDMNLNEVHQSWLSLIVGEQLSAAARSTLRASRWRNISSNDENLNIFHKEPNIKYSGLHKVCVEFAFILSLIHI